jgi:hypothetical protein
MLYLIDYTVSTLTGLLSGRYKNFENMLQNLVIHARRDPVWFAVLYLILKYYIKFLYRPADDDPLRVEAV